MITILIQHVEQAFEGYENVSLDTDTKLEILNLCSKFMNSQHACLLSIVHVEKQALLFSGKLWLFLLVHLFSM